MRKIRFTKGFSVLVAILSVSVMVPASSVPLASAQGACADVSIVGYITLSSPLSEQITATAVAFLIVAPRSAPTQGSRQLVNGIDAFVVDLQCNVGAATYCLKGTDNGLARYDLGLTFLTATLTPLDTYNDPASRDVCSNDLGQQSVPQNARYVVIFLEEGVPVAGLSPTFPARPYSARVVFEMTI